MIMETKIIRNLNPNIVDESVEKIMEPPLPIVPEDTDVGVIKPLLETYAEVLVIRKGELLGIITHSDLIRVVSKNSMRRQFC